MEAACRCDRKQSVGGSYASGRLPETVRLLGQRADRNGKRGRLKCLCPAACGLWLSLGLSPLLFALCPLLFGIRRWKRLAPSGVQPSSCPTAIHIP